MAGVMDLLIGEHKDIPIYAKNLYKWTPGPSILKQNVCWDAPIMEKLKCSYCSEFGDDLYEDNNIFIYINPEGYLTIGNHEGMYKTEIQFCPMCGRQLR